MAETRIATTKAEHRYSNVAVTLHWIMAGLIVFMIWLGRNMENHEARFQLHKSIGITLLFLTIARIMWRLYNPPPALPSDVKPLDAKLSRLVQFGFYALMLLIPLGGWIMVSVSEFRVPTVLFGAISWPSLPLPRSKELYEMLAFIHGNGATFGFLGLLFLHVSGAIKHQIGHETGVLRRILPGGNRPKTRGGAVTLATTLGLFAGIAILPLLDGPLKADSKTTSNVSPANWEYVADSGSITFSGVHDGNNFEGRFSHWETQIAFNSGDLKSSAVLVTVDLTSASTGSKLYDDSLKSAEWFDVKTNPKALVRLSNFKAAETGYEADAALTLKDKTATALFKFTLDIADDKTAMKGEALFTRSELNLGQNSDPDADWVSEDIVVKAQLEAEEK